MEHHPKFHEVIGICKRYPQRTRALFQTFIDVKYGQMLPNVETTVLNSVDLPAITSKNTDLFVPVYSNENLSVELLGLMADESKSLGIHQAHLAIVDTDSTVIYYKLSSGLPSIASLSNHLSKGDSTQVDTDKFC